MVAISKLYAHWTVINYRESYKIFASNGILFNHESFYRGETFVTKKIVKSLCKMKINDNERLYLGNLYAKRDWGHAKDYVEAMWLMLQNDKPDDFVIGTGKQYSVKDFAKLAFDNVGLDYKKYIIIKDNLRRPAEVDTLLANPKKAKKILKWKPKVSFKELVKDMVLSDLEFVKKEGY